MSPLSECFNMAWNLRIKVPATSANMGAGFDSLGVALDLYNTIDISTIKSGLSIYTEGMEGYIPHDGKNLIYRAMERVFDAAGYRPDGIRIVQRSQIPMTRGLGSSSACIIGGMVGANIIAGKPFSYPELLNLAVEMEGHPDNVTPALYGGLCIAALDQGKAYFKSAKLNPKIRFAVMVPDYFVATKKSRTVLPDQVSRKDAVFNISRAVLMYAALSAGDMSLLRVASQDRLHQSYRREYIDGMDEIFEKVYAAGGKCAYLSGSGPTILAVLDGGYQSFRVEMEDFFRKNSHQWSCKLLAPNNVGTVVKYMKRT